MKWFKHQSDASRGVSLSTVFRKFGAEGMLAYFLLLELASQKYDNEYQHENGTNFQFDEQVLKEYLRISTRKVGLFLEFFHGLSLISCGKIENIHHIDIPQLRSILNNHMIRKVKTTSLQRRNSSLDKDKERDIYFEKEKNVFSENPSSPEKVLEKWNEIADENDCKLGKARSLSAKRTKSITRTTKTTLKTIQDWESMFRQLYSSPFLLGETRGEWKASFDWAIMEDNALKVLEGNYANKQNKSFLSGDSRKNECDSPLVNAEMANELTMLGEKLLSEANCINERGE